MAKDTVPINTEIKQRIKQLQLDVALLKGVPKLSQLDLMDIMTKEYQEVIKK